MQIEDEKTALRWANVLLEVARLSNVNFGNVSIRIENGYPIGLVESRETFKLDMPVLEEKLRLKSQER
jgi:hypothetical protein